MAAVPSEGLAGKESQIVDRDPGIDTNSTFLGEIRDREATGRRSNRELVQYSYSLE